MKNNIIESYVNNLTKSDIQSFARKNGIDLNQNETDYLYDTVKKNWKTIIYGNPILILNKAQYNLSKETYNKVVSLLNMYKAKYKDYL